MTTHPIPKIPAGWRKLRLSPMDADGNKNLLLNRSQLSCANHWILADGFRVTLCAQKAGAAPTQQITISPCLTT